MDSVFKGKINHVVQRQICSIMNSGMNTIKAMVLPLQQQTNSTDFGIFDFVKPSTVSVFAKSWLTQISIVSSKGMLVKSDFTSKLPIDNAGSCSHISSANWNESLTLYSFLVKDLIWELKTSQGYM